MRFSLTELDVEQKRRIDDLKGQYKERETALQNRYKRLAAEVEEYVSAHRAELTGKSRRLKFGVVGYRLSSSLVTNLGEADTIALLEGMGHTELIKVTKKLDRAALMRQPAELLDRVDAWLKHGIRSGSTSTTLSRKRNARKGEQPWALKDRKKTG